MGRDVPAELEDDLGVRRERDRSRWDLDEPTRDIRPDRRSGREPGEAPRAEPLAPDPEQVADRERAAASDADHAVGAVGGERVPATRPDADPGGNDHDLPPDEELQMDAEGRPLRSAGQPRSGVR